MPVMLTRNEGKQPLEYHQECLAMTMTQAKKGRKGESINSKTCPKHDIKAKV
jgi:hypothetical protein